MNFSQRSRHYSNRKRELLSLAEKRGNTLRRNDLWRLHYYEEPYLIQASSDVLSQRFEDIFTNTKTLDEEGKIIASLLMQNDAFIIQRFAHIQEEINARYGGISVELDNQVRKSFSRYLKNGTPVGVELFKGLDGVGDDNTLVKFSQTQFVEEMLFNGRFRMVPASFYSQDHLLYSQQDAETKRDWILPKYLYRRKRIRKVNVFGNVLGTKGKDVTYSWKFPDYYMFSSCMELDRRMPSEFDANAALVITNKTEFIRRFEVALKSSLPDMKVMSGEVTYYDPYEKPIDCNPEFMKHFRFMYQKEHKIIARSRGQDLSLPLDPIFISLGSLEDIAFIRTHDK